MQGRSNDLAAQAGTASVGGGAGLGRPASAGGGPPHEAEAASEGAGHDMADDRSGKDPMLEALLASMDHVQSCVNP